MEFCKEEGLFCKAKSIVSSLYGIILWISTLPSIPMQNLPKHHQCATLPGLKTLIYSPSLQEPENPSRSSLIIHSYMIQFSHSQSPPSPSSSSMSPSLLTHFSPVVDDLIGTENGVYMNSSNEEHTPGLTEKKSEAYVRGENKQNHHCETTKKKYPPPIPLLARTGNLPGHMPWILTRHCTNGKLVLREERVKHHEYFEAHRANGRLILNLVSLDDKVKCNHSDCKNDQEELEFQDDLDDYFTQEEKEIQENIEDEEEEEEEETEALLMDDRGVATTPSTSSACSVPKSKQLEWMKGVVERNGDLRKCFTYAGKMISELKYLTSNAYRSGNAYKNCQEGSAPLAFNTSAIHQITAGVA